MTFYTLPGGKEKAVAYIFCKLTVAEQDYAQIQKVALGIVFGVQKFGQYLMDRKFQLITDHKLFSSQQRHSRNGTKSFATMGNHSIHLMIMM